ncbi:MAG TPA: RNA polymerase sigma-70 factor [Mucilaginibacter sp.]|jgi:RNA polymerase sigma-70 factor (ECF subfamily)
MLKVQTTDLELWKAICIDNELAFNELFDRYWVGLYKTANSYLKDKNASEEVVHDVFLNIWERRKELEIKTFPNFLLTATRYQIYNRMRLAKLPVVYMADNTYINAACDLNDGENKIREQELELELKQHLHALPKRCQEIFLMSRMEHISNQEIATRLRVSKKTVENQITIALKHLRVSFKYLVTLAIFVFLYL